MMAMLGWVLAALMLGVILGVGIALWLLRGLLPDLARVLPRAKAAAASGAPAGTVVTADTPLPEPPKPLINDEGREMLIQELMVLDGLPKAAAEQIATELLEAADLHGAGAMA